MYNNRPFIKIYEKQEYIDKIRKKSKKVYGKENLSQYVRDALDNVNDISLGKRRKHAKRIVKIAQDINILYLTTKDVDIRNTIKEIMEEMGELWDF